MLRVGRVVRAVGLRGEVEIAVESDNPDRFAVGSRFNSGSLVIATVRTHNDRTIVCFDGVTDRDGAEAIRGTVLEIDEAAARPLEEDEYWDHDLIGCTVVTLDGREIGTVDDVVHQPAGALLAVGTHLIPLVREVVKLVEDGRIIIDPIPGLLDD